MSCGGWPKLWRRERGDFFSGVDERRKDPQPLDIASRWSE